MQGRALNHGFVVSFPGKLFFTFATDTTGILGRKNKENQVGEQMTEYVETIDNIVSEATKCKGSTTFRGVTGLGILSVGHISYHWPRGSFPCC